MMTRPIPASGESLPVIGLGTSDEFERSTRREMEDLKQVLSTLVDMGGTLVDTAPTYGNAETVLGLLFTELNLQQRLFIASKISLWSVPLLSRQAGIDQMIESAEVLGKSPLDLIQVHNLNDLDTQWQNLVEWKAQGKVRYIGVTIYNYRQFERLQRFLRGVSDVDFVQLNYSVTEPRADEVLISLAVDKGAAIIANRPFANGGYFSRVRNKPLPDWAAEFDCESWAQFTLKWILGNPDSTCAIPATRNPQHMVDNARAGYGQLPDQNQRRRMLEYMRTI
jgi:diketogulonate reductase-like aldo/keto reductase